MVKQLIYKSQCTTEISQPLVEDILFAANPFNEANGITGLLLYSGDVFLQLLEGAPGDVDDLYRRILNDTRHTNINTVYLGYADERAYPGWGMHASSGSETPLQLLNTAQRDFMTSAKPPIIGTGFQSIWIGPFMRSVCKEHLPEKRPEKSSYN